MRATRIKDYEARNIACAMSKKAFEHLTTPFEEQLANFARGIYKRINDDIGFQKLLKLGLVNETSKFFVNLKNDKNHEIILSFASDNGDEVLFQKCSYGHLEFFDQDLYEEVLLVWRKLEAIQNERHLLESDIQSQLTGKSTLKVMKNWPEAEGFLRDEFGLLAKEGMDVPFSALLTKYLVPQLGNNHVSV